MPEGEDGKFRSMRVEVKGVVVEEEMLIVMTVHGQHI